MMDKAVLWKVRPGKLDQWRQWCAQIRGDAATEAIETLKEENVAEELCVLLLVGGEHYVVGLVRADGPRPPNPSRPINQLHSRMKQECLAYVGEQEILYRLAANGTPTA